jgi:hypothetical protein
VRSARDTALAERIHFFRVDLFRSDCQSISKLKKLWGRKREAPPPAPQAQAKLAFAVKRRRRRLKIKLPCYSVQKNRIAVKAHPPVEFFPAARPCPNRTSRIQTRGELD